MYSSHLVSTPLTNLKIFYSRYDRLGRQTSITGYADGSTAQETGYDYDKLGRVINVTYPDADDIDFEYNKVGKVSKRTDQRGLVTTYSYDDVYNLESKTVTVDSVTTTESFTYDGLGRMLSADKDEGATAISYSEFTYNAVGKVTEAQETIKTADAETINYEYDQAGNLTKITYPDANTVEITPDALGRIGSLDVDDTTEAEYKYVGGN